MKDNHLPTGIKSKINQPDASKLYDIPDYSDKNFIRFEREESTEGLRKQHAATQRLGAIVSRISAQEPEKSGTRGSTLSTEQILKLMDTEITREDIERTLFWLEAELSEDSDYALTFRMFAKAAGPDIFIPLLATRIYCTDFGNVEDRGGVRIEDLKQNPMWLASEALSIAADLQDLVPDNPDTLKLNSE